MKESNIRISKLEKLDKHLSFPSPSVAESPARVIPLESAECNIHPVTPESRLRVYQGKGVQSEH